jgi:hypothetical protein
MLFFIRILVDKNKELIYREAEFIGGFMHRLMKPKNTGNKWTREEKKHLITDLRHLSYYVPVLMIFLMPGGSFYSPCLRRYSTGEKNHGPSRRGHPYRSLDEAGQKAGAHVNCEVIIREFRSACFSFSHRALSPSGNF